MKRSKTYSVSKLSDIYLWMLPIVLILPNIILDFTEQSYSLLDRLINVLLPAGVWLALAACVKRTWIAGFAYIPVMVLGAFQIVLLFLYGESIIAVDMFLNVVTTNPSEACELLGNLGMAIATVCLIYIPLIIVGVMLCVKHSIASPGNRRVALLGGAGLTGIGLILLAVASLTDAGYRIDRRLFPVNVMANMIEAGHRAAASVSYSDTSAGYSYHAACSDTCSRKEIVVMVVGETSRSADWQLNGYERDTNPRLSRRSGLVSFSRALSESNTTHKSVPLLLSHFSAVQFADSLNICKGVVTAFNEAGYTTAWISNQRRNHSYIDAFGAEADTCLFLYDDGNNHYDGDLCGYLKDEIERAGDNRLFVVLHTYGSHFNYSDRYPAEACHFGGADDDEATSSNRQALIDAYDNTVRYTDTVLDSIAAILEATGRPAAMLYASDHGEDIYDDSRERFLHASPTPTYCQLHVPVVAWLSESYREEKPQLYDTMLANADKNVSSSRSVAHTLMMLGGITSPVFEPDAALCSDSYCEPSRVFLNDYNEAVSLHRSGMRDYDFRRLALAGISAE